MVLDENGISSGGEVADEMTAEDRAIFDAMQRGDVNVELPPPADHAPREQAPVKQEPEAADEPIEPQVPEDEPEVEAEPEDKPEDKAKVVPLWELKKAERSAAKAKREREALQKEIEARDARHGRLEERLQALQEAQANREAAAQARQAAADRAAAEQQVAAQRQQQQEVDPEPDKANDYGSWLEWNQRRMQARLDYQEQVLNQRDQAQSVDRQNWMMAQTVKAQTESFIAEGHSDYHAAVKHLYATLDRFYKVATPDPEQRKAAITSHLVQVALSGVQTGQSAAKVYELAKEAGWNPTLAAPAPRQASKVAVLNRANRGASTLSNLGGGSGGRSKVITSLEDLDNMTDEEFEAFKESGGDLRDV